MKFLRRTQGMTEKARVLSFKARENQLLLRMAQGPDRDPGRLAIVSLNCYAEVLSRMTKKVVKLKSNI